MLDRHLELESLNMIPGFSLNLVPQGLAISKEVNRQMKERHLCTVTAYARATGSQRRDAAPLPRLAQRP